MNLEGLKERVDIVKDMYEAICLLDLPYKIEYSYGYIRIKSEPEMRITDSVSGDDVFYMVVEGYKGKSPLTRKALLEEVQRIYADDIKKVLG